MVVEAIHFRHRDYLATVRRLERVWHRTIHLQGKMRPKAVIIGQVICQQPPEMRLAEHDDVIQDVSANRLSR
jgi:hypothetical protein